MRGILKSYAMNGVLEVGRISNGKETRCCRSILHEAKDGPGCHLETLR